MQTEASGRAKGAEEPAHREGFPIYVAGLGAVGVALVHRLHALGVPVRAVLSPLDRQRQSVELGALGIDLVQGSGSWGPDLARQDLASAGGVVLAADDDAQNVDACLIVRRASPDVPILVRVSDPTLVRFLQMSVPHIDVYSMGSTTAPVAAELAMHLLSEHKAHPHPHAPPPSQSLAIRRPSAVLAWALLGCALTVLPATFLIAGALHLSWLAAAHAAWLGLMSHGEVGANLLQASPLVRTVSVVLAVAGKVGLACGIALLLDWLLTLRLAAVAASTAVRSHGHVVVFGAGNVGARVAELMQKRRVAVAVVEVTGNIRNVQRLRSKGIKVIVGDATLEETLRLAGAYNAGVALALTNSDAVNLNIGLQMSDKKVGVPTVVRLVSPELSSHVAAYQDMVPVSPVAETASHVCRTAERVRIERISLRHPTQPPPEMARPTGRFAGPEFQQPVAGAAHADEATAAPAVADGAVDVA